MSETAIRVENLGKLYRIGQIVGYSTLRESLMNVAYAPFRWLRRTEDRRQEIGQKTEESGPPSSVSGHPNTIWALKDVSFEVKRGEAVGIIGRNGSGKTTILKILSRITAPTEGRVEIHGRVGSLLEVGTGFHPELTGRENIYLNGAVIGMKKAEVARKFDEIVAFSEIEKFLDTPVKRYSSGMYVRLAFAVAAHLEPEILIVDEVLAVGDAAFQKKCLGKMSNVASEGRTVLFVSHNIGAVLTLCRRGLLLENGCLLKIGDAKDVVDSYISSALKLSGEVILPKERKEASNDFRFCAVRIRRKNGQISRQVDLNEGCDLEIDYEIIHPIRAMNMGFILWNGVGQCVFTSTDVDSNPASMMDERRPGLHVARCHIPPDLLRPGSYYIDAAASVPNVRMLDSLSGILAFEVVDTGSVESHISQGRQGIVAPTLTWFTRQIE